MKVWRRAAGEAIRTQVWSSGALQGISWVNALSLTQFSLLRYLGSGFGSCCAVHVGVGTLFVDVTVRRLGIPVSMRLVYVFPVCGVCALHDVRCWAAIEYPLV